MIRGKACMAGSDFRSVELPSGKISLTVVCVGMYLNSWVAGTRVMMI